MSGFSSYTLHLLFQLPLIYGSSEGVVIPCYYEESFVSVASYLRLFGRIEGEAPGSKIPTVSVASYLRLFGSHEQRGRNGGGLTVSVASYLRLFGSKLLKKDMAQPICFSCLLSTDLRKSVVVDGVNGVV